MVSEWGGAPCEGDSLVEAALKVLMCSKVELKAEYTNKTVALWRSGNMAVLPPGGKLPIPVPERPAREDDKVTIVQPGRAPKRGKGGSLASRQAIVHSLVHIESWAVDLSWDIIVRYTDVHPMPRDFYDDFVTVAEDECRHYLLLKKRLQEMGSHYGAFPVHDGLWESAMNTSDSLAARLAVEHCTHEARGLDVLPMTIDKFRKNKDLETATLLETTVYPEEVPSIQNEPWAIEARKYEKVQEWFQTLCAPPYFWGKLKGPFNMEARMKAGFTEEWFMPLVEVPSDKKGVEAAEKLVESNEQAVEASA
eukprot:gene16832-23113_t